MTGGSGSEALLVVLQHADSAFPSGGFAFSQGLEASAALGERLGGFGLEAFVRNQLLHRWATADRVALVRSHRLACDLPRIAELDREVEASTTVEPLRNGSRRNGMALLTAHARLGAAPADTYRKLVGTGGACGHLAVVQGLVWRAAGMSEDAAVAASGYQCAMSLATAGVRLGLVGAIEAQAIVGRCLAPIASAARGPVDGDTPLASFVPLAEIAALGHGASGQRLFSN
jgi:urease accessory protein